jgi:bifunctional non-homologous end joining protein LigD
VAEEAEVLEVEGREIRVTNPGKVYFPKPGVTKLDVVRYFVDVGEGALTGARDRPTSLHRFPDGFAGESFYQKRVPKHAPEWVRTVTIRFPSGRSADEVVVADVAHLAWMATLGCLEINPWPVRADDTDHPDELRVDLDPTPRIPFASVRKVALVVREVLEEHGLTGYPKTSGKRGIHVLSRIERRWEFSQVRTAALALAREVERRSPLATSAWWKEQRRGVFVDYNQNARDRTVASAYSIRPVPDARVSCPLEWDEVSDVDPRDLTVLTVPGRFAERGDAHAGIDEHVGSIESLLELLEREERAGVPDAPWPVHHPKMPGEPTRVAPSRARKRD